MAVFVKFVAFTRSLNTLRFPWTTLEPPGSQTVSLIPQESTCIPAAPFFQLILFFNWKTTIF